MYRPLGGDLIYTKKLNRIPILHIPYPIFQTLIDNLQIPSPQRIISIIVKLLTLKRVNTIDQILHEVSQLDHQDRFPNKILIIYVIALFMIPIRSFERQNQKRTLTQQTNYVMAINNNQPQKIELQIYSTRTQSKQQAFSNVWSMIDEQLQKYKISIISRNNEVLQLMYNQPILEGQVRLPSLLRIENQKHIQFVYHYSKPMKGIKLREYMHICALIHFGNTLYEFEKFIISFAQDLQKNIKMENKSSKYYFVLSFDNIFICDGQKSIVEIDIASVQMNEWSVSKLPQNFNSSIYADQFAKTSYESAKKADLWSAAIIILEAIAFRYNICRFKRQLQSSQTQDQMKTYLSEFIMLIEEQNLIVDNHLMMKIKKWLHFEIEDHFQQQPQQLQLQKSNEQNENLYREEELQKIYATSSYESQKNILKYQLQDNQQNHIIQGQQLNTEQFIQTLENRLIYNSQKLNNIFAQPLTQDDLATLQQKVLSDTNFLSSFGYSLKSYKPSNSICKNCKAVAMVYINFCGHGQCENCFIKYLEFEIINKKQKPINCPFCNQTLSLALLIFILDKNINLKRLFCKYFIVAYAINFPNQYLYCQKEVCLKNPIIYHKLPSKILICKNCNIAYCSNCKGFFHQPLKCQQFKSLKHQLENLISLRLQQIGWPNFMAKKIKVKKCQRKLGLQETHVIQNFQIIIKQWLVLDYCQNFVNKKKDSGKRILQLLCITVANNLKEIYSFCNNDDEQSVECLEQCFKLRGIHDIRQQILASIFI